MVGTSNESVPEMAIDLSSFSSLADDHMRQ